MKHLSVIDLKSAGLLRSRWMRQYRLDILIVVALAIAIAISTYTGTYQIPDPIITDFYAQDVWFGSDIPTVFGNITSTNSDFGRNNKHPLFPLFVFPFVFSISKILHLDSLSSVRILIVLVAVFWIGSLYTLFRVMHCYRLDAILFSILGGVSTASIFWLSIPESFSFGSVTILLGLIFVALTQYRSFSIGWYVAVNILTVSITITNSMVGIFATVINHRWKKVIQIGIVALLLSTGLWILQRIVFSNSGFPFQPGTFIGEKKFISTPGEGGLLAFMSSLFLQTMVMPAIKLINSPSRPDWVKLDTDILAPASGGIWGMVAVIAWSGLLLLGVWGFFSTKEHSKLRIVLGLTLIAQILMHSIYGVEETFLYSLHFLPLLLVLAAFSLFTSFRLLSLALALALIISAGINNRAQFSNVATTLWNYGTPQQQVQAQMKRRPFDPWPRSVGHVILATPGSSPDNKAFYEPGGSFSPNPGSFGVSIWVADRQGNLKATSDSIPLRDLQQQFIDIAVREKPGILSKTAYYESSWSAVKSDSWKLNLKPINNADRISVVIRSVGPAGGAIRSLDWNGQRLLIGDRWIVKDIPRQAKVYLGSENTARWKREQSPRSRWLDPNGWAYARIELAPGESGNFLIEDSQPISEPALKSSGMTSTLTLDLPDSQFVNSLKAQVSHLMMGLVGNRTHPSDPISYPLPRFRDGAYQMVALTHAGQLNVAKQLSPYFAENDFFNSTLPEADIPGLGIWALEEVAIALQQPDYDRWLWPHIRRKAALIGDMLLSNRPGYPVLEKAKSPFSENPDLIRVDLLAGKMTKTPHEISLNPAANIISYRALLDAATLADRLKQPNDAKRWRSQAAQLKTAWQKANQTEFSAFANGLWPSGIAEGDRVVMAKALQKHWNASRDAQGAFQPTSQEMHSNVAEAHQWILLDQPDRAWSALKWFWQNQASPGLYTWSGNRAASSEIAEPKSFSQWHRLRGRVTSQYLAPHYWTSAEMLLLQLDMLTYADRSAKSPTLVIGAGMPKTWLSQPMSVQGQWVDGNLVDWAWDGRQMNVQIRGKKMDIQLGTAFPAKTPVKLAMLQK